MRFLPWFLLAIAAVVSIIGWDQLPTPDRSGRVALLLCVAAVLTALTTRGGSSRDRS
ncbi:hypothetical protein [Kutzneria chonburiensis]|uniref:Uncharacterized protein n=1 Tax=Kutzneria chonburiensis TaxID=1483604 RepID=A0ABV6MK56_9PSEU|nr:hypothetical protein [Kutzneria chonburiensis]